MSSDREKDLDAAFRESPEFGVSVLHESFRYVIVGTIISNCLGLKAAEIDDLVMSTLIEVLRAARKPSFDPTDSLKLVKTIAARRAIDQRRRNGRSVRASDEYKDHVIEDMKGTRLGLRSRFDVVDYGEFDIVLRKTISSLPPMQKLAAEWFCNLYEEIRETNSYAKLAEAMSTVMGRPVTVSAAKSAWYEAQAKIVEELRRHGFDLWRDES